jgi:hypothetical protein
MQHELRAYAYVNRPLEVVSDALITDAETLFSRATTNAARHVVTLPVVLTANIGGVELGAEIAVKVNGVEIGRGDDGRLERTTLQLAWKAVKHPNLFPTMRAKLAVYRLTSKETQLDLQGQYEPPLGVLGDAVDAAVGHRFAEASIEKFVADVAGLLSEILPEKPIAASLARP